MKAYQSSKSFSLTLLLLVLLKVELGAAEAWRTHIDFVNEQSFGFGTGNEHGADMKVEIYHQCRMEGAQRIHVGEFFPSSSVQGIDADQSNVINNPGEGNSISFSFTEGIAGNTNIYTDNGDNTAKVEFCVQVGLYYYGDLINFAEVKMTYWVDLITHFTSLQGYSVTQAEEFNDQGAKDLTFDGTLLAYFCNPFDYQELQNDGSINHQGSVVHLCFKAPSGQFEVSDILDLTVKNALADSPSQTILSGGAIASPGYAEKNCFDGGSYDTNLCLVSFVLTAAFYDYNAITLTGDGSVKLEFGGASGQRTLSLVRGKWQEERMLQPPETSDSSTLAKFKVKAMQIRTEPNLILTEATSGLQGDITHAAIAILVVVFVFAGAKEVCIRCNSTTSRRRNQKILRDQRTLSRRIRERDHISRYRQVTATTTKPGGGCGSSCTDRVDDNGSIDVARNATQAPRQKECGPSCTTNSLNANLLEDSRTKKLPPTRFSSLSELDLDAGARLSAGSAVAMNVMMGAENGFTTIDMDDEDLDPRSVSC